MLRVKATAVATICLSIIGCGGGGSSNTETDNNNSSGNNTTVLTGVFVDSAVEGVTYATATQSGTTNEQGQFNYIAGEEVTFSIGATQLPTVTAAAQVSPVDMAAGTADPSATTTNIARLLQSLDDDGNPDNGITIPASAAATAATINFNVSVTDFENDPAVINLVSNSGSTTTMLISADAANQHLNETIGAPNPTPPQSMAGFTREMLVGRYIIPDANNWDTTQLNMYRFDSADTLTVLGTPEGILRWGEFPWSVGADSVVIVDFNEFSEGVRSGYALESIENDVLRVRINFLDGGQGEVFEYTLSKPLTPGDLAGREITVNASAGQGVIQYGSDGNFQLLNSSGESVVGTYSQHPIDGITLRSNGNSYSELALASGTLDSGIVLKWDYLLDGFIQILRVEFFRTSGNTWNSIATRERDR